jgi:thioesterase domain-containing protein
MNHVAYEEPIHNRKLLLKYQPDRPLYALCAKGHHTGEGAFRNLDEMLRCYYDAIRRVQPNGPYALLGYCFSGLLTFELTKMLEAAGEEVNFCGGIDNPPLLKLMGRGAEYRGVMITMLPTVSNLSKAEAQSFALETADLADPDFYEVLFTKFSADFMNIHSITVKRLQAFGRVEDCTRSIAHRYEPHDQAGTMDIFCAYPLPHFGVSPGGWRKDVLRKWDPYVKDGKVQYHEVLGTHLTLMQEPQVAVFQQMLKKALETRGVV